MKTHFDCLPCIVRQAIDASRFVTNNMELQEEIIRQVIVELAEFDLNESPPYMSQIIHRKVRELSGIGDPYREVKHKFTLLGLELYEELKELVEKSEDPFMTALKLSIAGNIIDFGVFEQVSDELVYQSINNCLEAPLPLDVVENLKYDILKAANILFLGDNAGETVFDRLLLEQMPIEKIIYVVKGAPIVNDAIMEDAEEAGLTDLLRVIDNGSDAQGTITSLCSAEFNTSLEDADLIIAKGQAHYETMSHMELNCIYHLFQAKCSVISGDLGCEEGEMVILRKTIR